VLWCCGAVVLWCCGAVVLWCCGAVVLWCCGAVVLWCRSAVVLWCSVGAHGRIPARLLKPDFLTPGRHEATATTEEN